MSGQVRALYASPTLIAAAITLLLAFTFAHAQSVAAYQASAIGRAAEQKGLAAARRSDFAEARANFLAARESDPYWPDNLYYLGLATSKLPGLELSAAAWFEAYLALEPKTPRAADIRTTIGHLVQTGRDHATVLTGAMQRMADAFPSDELDARKAHEVLLTDELALLPLAHSDPNAYDMISNGIYPPLQGDTSKAWSAAAWLTEKGVDKESLAREFAGWGRVELSSRILDKGQNGEDWFDYIPELVGGRFLTEITARTMFRPGDLLPQEKLSLQTLCDASIDFAAKEFVLNSTDQRQEAMYTIRACAVAAIQASDPAANADGNKSLGVNPELADVIEFYLDDGNSKAAMEVYDKMDFDSLKQYAGHLIGATQDKWGGKPGASEQVQIALHNVDLFRSQPAAAAAVAAGMPAADAYLAQKQEEQNASWARADSPASFVSRFGPHSHGAVLSPREAVDEWENIAKSDLSGDWFEHYESQLQTLRARTAPNAIDKAGDLFSASADAAKVLLDALTEVTAYQRSMVIYRPAAVPLPYTWKPAPAAN
jgi:hypothetical protein